MAPPVMVNALWLNSMDTNENQSAGMWTLQDQSALVTTPYDALITASANLSEMALFASMLQKRAMRSDTALVGPYSTYRDQAVFQVQSNNGIVDLVIPGPVASIFRSDGITVDLSNALVQAWWVQVQAILGDSLGSPWTSLLSGRRRMIQAGIPAGL